MTRGAYIRYRQHELSYGAPRFTDIEETRVESIINPGGDHGNWRYHRWVSLRVRGAGVSHFVVSI